MTKTKKIKMTKTVEKILSPKEGQDDKDKQCEGEDNLFDKHTV